MMPSEHPHWIAPLASDDTSGGRPRFVTLRKGRWYWEPSPRLRKSRNLKTVPLGGDQAAAFAVAERLNRDVDELDVAGVAPGSVRWLFDQFEASERFAKLAPATCRDYRWLGKRLSTLDLGEHAFGEFLAHEVRARHADRIYALLVEATGPTAAHYACRYARRVWHWGGRREYVPQHPNPWSGMELPSVPQRQQRWTRDQVAAVVAKAGEAGKPSIGLAVLLAYWLGHRQGDVLTLTWAAVDAGLRKTAKTGVTVPVVSAAYPDLAAALDSARAAGGTVKLPTAAVVACEATGLTWNGHTFRHEFRAIADSAGVPADLQFRDLRATAMTELADAGADDIEATTHSGHMTATMRRRYARRTPEQFRSAAKKRLAARERSGDD